MAATIDADTHLDVGLRDLAAFAEPPWRQALQDAPLSGLLPHGIGDLHVAGRIRRGAERGAPTPAAVAADLRIVLPPTELFGISCHPNPLFEVAVARAYARWLVEVHLPRHPDDRGLLYLPMSAPEECRRLVAELAGAGVCGAVVASVVPLRVHANPYMELYAELQERGLLLAFHPVSAWSESPLGVFDTYLPVWAFGYPFHQCVHLWNWVLHALADRFPGLDCLFYEAGVAWLTFALHRMDSGYLKRPSEAPLLRERPSRYMRRCWFSTQPLDHKTDMRSLEPPMRFVGLDRFVYASNFPEWDFDAPTVVDRLPFLDAAERAAILGGNALRLLRRTGAASAPGTAPPTLPDA